MSEDLGWSPVTLERENVIYPILIGTGATYEPEQTGFGGTLGEVIVHDMTDGKIVPVGEILNKSSEEFRFRQPNGSLVIVRPTRPDDAAVTEQFGGYDLPLDVIGALVNNVILGDNLNVTAAVDDEGDVHTMLLETALGIYARYSKQWIKLTDVGVISHLNVVDVLPEDLNTYDEADINGNMVNLTDLNPTNPVSVEVIQEPPAKPVTAAGPVRAVVVASLAELPAALRYAMTEQGEGSRFYLARRAKALGWQHPLPWEE